MAPRTSADPAKVTIGLRDPQNPTVCVACLGSITAHCDLDESSQYLADLRRNHKGLLNAALSYMITGSCLDEETLALHRPLALWVRQCTISIPTREVKRRTEHRKMRDFLSTGVTHVDVDLVCSLLSHCLYAARRDSTQRFSRHFWPTKVEDLLPAGPEETLRALCVWLRRLDSMHVERVVLYVYRACNVELRPHDGILIGALVAALESTTSGLVHTSAVLRTDDDALACRQPTLLLDHLVRLLFEIWPSLYQCVSDPPLLWSLVCAINRALDVATTQHTVALLVRIGELLYSMYDPPLAPMHVHPRTKEQIVSQPYTTDSFHTLHGCLLDAHKRRACGWPACRITERNTGRPLSLCARCRIYRYCSQECQRQHWRSSHKSVCTGLGRLFAATNISIFSAELSRSEFVAACRAAEFGADDISAIARIYGSITADDPMKPEGGTEQIWESLWLEQYKIEMEEKLDTVLEDTAI